MDARGKQVDIKDEASAAGASPLTPPLGHLGSPRQVNFVIVFDPEPAHHCDPVLAEKKQRAGIFV